MRPLLLRICNLHQMGIPRSIIHVGTCAQCCVMRRGGGGGGHIQGPGQAALPCRPHMSYIKTIKELNAAMPKRNKPPSPTYKPPGGGSIAVWMKVQVGAL